MPAHSSVPYPRLVLALVVLALSVLIGLPFTTSSKSFDVTATGTVQATDSIVGENLSQESATAALAVLGGPVAPVGLVTPPSPPPVALTFRVLTTVLRL
jgi:hypothetical protein